MKKLLVGFILFTSIIISIGSGTSSSYNDYSYQQPSYNNDNNIQLCIAKCQSDYDGCINSKNFLDTPKRCSRDQKDCLRYCD